MTRDEPESHAARSDSGMSVGDAVDPPVSGSEGVSLGAGRSAEVRLVEEGGRKVARKTFGGDRLAKLAQYVLAGAPNPYAWNEDAIRSAVLRRELVGLLLSAWFGDRVRVAAAYEYAWDEDARAFRIDTEYIDGRPPRLLHPFRTDDDELERLTSVMQDLQERFEDAGLYGLVWQVGKGHPVALANLMLEDTDDGLRFVIIDLESGVPAVFPLNPVTLFTYYIPKSVRFRRVMFDDIDEARLGAYLDEHRAELESRLGAAAYGRLREVARELGEAQAAWKSQPLHERSIEYALRKERISPEQAERYRRTPLLWDLREGARFVTVGIDALFVRLPRKILSLFGRIGVLEAIREAWRFMTSAERRLELARRYARGRIERWVERGQLEDGEARELEEELEGDHQSGYLSDFGMHLGLKVAVQLFEWLILAPLLVVGVIDVVLFGILLAADGPIFRSIYTLYRMVAASARGRERPWTALVVGLVPLLGSLAFPSQMLVSAQREKARVAKFLVFDSFGRIGVKIPVFGGEDTQTEHVLNRWAARVTRAKE